MRVSPILPKALYFTFFLALGITSPYYSVLLSDIVPTPWVGWTMGLLQSCGFLLAPMWGMVADVTQRHRLVLSILLVTGLGARVGLFFLLEIGGGGQWVPWLAAIIMVGSEMLFCGVVPIIDSLVCKTLKEGEEFGHQRLFGAISWGVVVPLAGLAYTRVHMKWGLIVTWVSSFPVVLCLYFAAPANDASGTSAKKLSFMESVRSTRLTWQQICFLSCALFSGFCNASIGTFLFLHLQNMGGNSTMMGLSVLFTILSEIPFMYFSSRIAQKIGTFTCVELALVAYTLRLFGYQALGTWISPWFVLLIEPLHGITFGIFYSVCVSYIANGLSIEGTRSTWQGIFAGLLAFGRASGSIGGGYIFVAGGGVLLFRVGCIILACVTAAFFFVVLTDRGYVPLEAGLALKEEQLELELLEVFSADEEEEDEKFSIDPE